MLIKPSRMPFYRVTPRSFYFLRKLRQPVVDINNVATSLIIMYLYTFVTTVVYEKKDIYIYIPNSSNLLLNLVIVILYKESYFRRQGRSDYMIFYSSFYLDNAE